MATMSHKDSSQQPVDTDQNPSKKYALYAYNDELVDKLKLLDYENGYVKMHPMHRPIARDYFVKSTNVGEQFHLFTTLCAWLIQKAIDPSFSVPQESDEPNATISNILNAARSNQIVVDFGAHKLKSGAGQHCLHLLNQLADLALINTKFRWNRAEPVTENDEEEDNVAVDQAEITTEQFDDDSMLIAAEDDDTAGTVLDLQATRDLTTGFQHQNDIPVAEILRSDGPSLDAWKMEVERVTPQLKVTLRSITKDWRMRLEQMKGHHTALKELQMTMKPSLNNTWTEIEKEMSRVAAREKHLNGQLESVLSKFRGTKDEMAELQEKYKLASVGIADRGQILQRVSDDLEEVKQQIDETDRKNSDGAPMLKLKQALLKMESDIIAMDIQIGVIEQSLFQAQLKSRTHYMTFTADNLHTATN